MDIKSTPVDPVAFFAEHAGYSYDPRTQTPEEGRLECARKLADAERRGSDAGISFQWKHDDITNAEFEDTDAPYPLWLCLCFDENGSVVASVGGVDFGRDGVPQSDPYRRVVEAEMALEAMDA